MNRIRDLLQILRYFIPTLWVNFKCLPFCQAIKLPILVYKPHFRSLKGKIVIESENVRFGMIRMGFFTCAIFPNNGFVLQNEGVLIFKGRFHMGNDCYVICGKQGRIEFGDDFRVTAGLKMVSQCGMTFGKETRIGWGNLIIDSNFHPLYDTGKKKFKKAFGKINIGASNWFATQCMVMPGVSTPERCIFGARTIVTCGAKYESFCVHGGSPVRVLSHNVMRIIGQDFISDYSCD